MSSSSTEGTYCRQIGSLGDLIKSTMAGEIRNSKFSAAWRSRSRSGKFSDPNLAANASREAMEFFFRTSCQVSAMQATKIAPHRYLPLTAHRSLLPEHVDYENHLIASQRIKVGDPRNR